MHNTQRIAVSANVTTSPQFNIIFLILPSQQWSRKKISPTRRGNKTRGSDFAEDCRQ